MPIFVGDFYLLDYSFNVIIGCVNHFIHLRLVQSEISMLNVELLAQCIYNLLFKLVPLSVMINSKVPYLTMMSFFMNLTTTPLVTFTYEDAPTHMVK